MSEPTPILLPQVGNTMEDGTIVSWKVKPGDWVKPGQVLFEMETDKATVEVEAEVPGRLSRILVPDGTAAAVKTVIAYLSEDDEAVEKLIGAAPAPSLAPAPAAAPRTQSAPPSAPPPARPDGLFDPTRKRISPAARKAAEALGVSADKLAGTGPDGRVTSHDVEKAALSAPAQAPRRIAGGAAVWQVKTVVDAGPLLARYREARAQFTCCLNDLAVLAAARVLQGFPELHSQADGSGQPAPDVSIGLAMTMEQGLVVPVLSRADGLSLKGVAGETRRLIRAAREGHVERKDDSCFTVYDFSMHEIEEMAAPLAPSERAVLSLGAVREGVLVRDGAIRPGRLMTLVLTADASSVDGGSAVRFMARLKALLEDPSRMGA